MPLRAGDFESPVSANFTIRAFALFFDRDRYGSLLRLCFNNVTAKHARSQIRSRPFRVYSFLCNVLVTSASKICWYCS